jgi:hypothetical protein
MKTIQYVITNCGDGSNGIHWVKDIKVLERMEELADDGDEGFASGDGLQNNKLHFSSEESLKEFEDLNHILYTTLDDLDDNWVD